jgi:hypothetical protein
MTTRCERQGQTEIGFIEHEGREYAALGATVNGRYLTAYTKIRNGTLNLTSWWGKTMLACRSEIAETFNDDSCAVVFSLTRSRFVVGYALAGDGMLFRGELVTGCSLEEARRAAVRIADYFSELDAEDNEEAAWE